MPHKVEQGPERDDELPRRNRPPVHYEVEINSVEELLKLSTYESGVFEAGGYLWSLCLYLPRGPDGKVDSKGHMSLYLSMEEPNKLGDGEKIVVDYKFFAFDYNKWTYVTFKEKGKELRAISKAKTKVGLPKFLSLAGFQSRFHKDDHCIFGAEVMVSKSKRKMETLTIVRNPLPNKINCEIRQFSTSKKHPQYSEAFPVGGQCWMLNVFPQRSGAQQRKWLSVYLQVQGLRSTIKMYVEAKLRVLNKKYTKNYKEETVSGWLSEKNCNCGRPNFMLWEDFENGGFVDKKELAFEVNFLVISNVQRSDESV